MKPYASYKPSGVAWLGDIPRDWNLKRVKHITRHTTGWTPPTGNRAGYDGPNLWATIADLGDSVINDTRARISDEAAVEAGIRPSPAGSLLFSFKLSVGQVSIVGEPMYTNEAIATFLPSQDYLVSWAFYAFPVFIPENSAINIYGARLLNQQRINDAFLPIPSLSEQHAIADYLDTETARIDTLVQEKEELIGLLREAKLSTVSSILLGGLVGEIKKPSNTKWLGDIPASWVVCRVKHAVMRIEQGWSPECENRLCAPGEWGVLKAGACNHGRFNQAEHKFLPATLNPIPEYEVFAGDVLMSRASGSADLVGSVAFVDEVQPHLMLSDKLFRLVPEEHVDGRYLAWALNTDAQRRQILNCVRGAEGLARNITTTDIKQLWIALPTLDEQKQLAVEANKVASGFDALITHTQEEITLLKELRAATIADAVLGRVDVRSLTQKQ